MWLPQGKLAFSSDVTQTVVHFQRDDPMQYSHIASVLCCTPTFIQNEEKSFSLSASQTK